MLALLVYVHYDTSVCIYTYPMKILTVFLVPIIILITLLFVQLFGLSFPLHVTSTSATNADFSVIGEGKIDVIPDLGFVDVGIVVNKADTAESAQNQISKIHNQIVEKMNEFGIKEEDIKTTNFSVNPNYDYSSGNNVIQGYNGNAQLSIKVRKVETMGEVAKTATSAGANEIYNTRYSVSTPEKYREQARTKAIENAKEQAQKLATQLGIRLGKVTNVIESSAGSNPIYFEKSSMGMGGGGGGAPDLQPGEQTITSTVTLFFEKK